MTSPFPYESFPLLQFGVDNASSLELSARILLSEIVTHPTWVSDYLRIAPTSIRRAFLFEMLRHPVPTYTIPLLREIVGICVGDVDTWLLRSVCQRDDPALLAVFLEYPAIAYTIDDHLCAFVFRNEALDHAETLFEMLESAVLQAEASSSSSSSSKDHEPPKPTM